MRNKDLKIGMLLRFIGTRKRKYILDKSGNNFTELRTMFSDYTTPVVLIGSRKALSDPEWLYLKLLYKEETFWVYCWEESQGEFEQVTS